MDLQAMRGGIAIGSVDWKNETDPIVAHANAPPNNATVTFVARPSPMTLKHVFTDHGAKLGGKLMLSTGLQVAGLALTHRQNKSQRQRIVVFVGSPGEEEEMDLEDVFLQVTRGDTQ